MQLTWSGQWPLNAWPNIVITAVLIVIAVTIARRRVFSVGNVFLKADSAFVGVLRARFPLKAAR